jgi:hypothetical protein
MLIESGNVQIYWLLSCESWVSMLIKRRSIEMWLNQIPLLLFNR